MKVLTELLKEKYKLDKIKEITKVIMDSRKIEEGALFFAINNGNSYIDDVLKKGVSLVIADNYSGNDIRVIKVKDSILELQELATEYRKALGIKVIGITGSNGKTTTKDIIHSILSQKYSCKKTEGNYNNHIGLPFTILQLQDGDEVSVLEMGMSEFGEIDRLCQIAQPDYGVITNIGDSHLEYLKTRENVFKAKGEMIKYILPENLIIYGNDFYLKSVNGITIGYGDNCQNQIKDYFDSDGGIKFTIGNEEYRVNLNGKHNCINSAMAITIGKEFNLTFNEIQAGLNSLNLTPMRFQRIEKGETLYINDAYNASPISMKYSLETFDKLYNDRDKIVVLGDMLELGENEIEFHKEVLEKALEIKVNKIYIYGTRMEKAYNLLNRNKNIEYFSEKELLKDSLREEFPQRKAVLLKGSRGMKMEDVIEG